MNSLSRSEPAKTAARPSAQKTDFETNRAYSQAQLAHQQAFREAIVYAQAMKGAEIYSLKANGSGKSPFNVAVADWFNEPEILEVDLSGWNGASGEVIRMRVRDDVKVERVSVRTCNGTDTPWKRARPARAVRCGGSTRPRETIAALAGAYRASERTEDHFRTVR